MILAFAGWLCLLPVAVPSIVFAVELGLGLLPARRLPLRENRPRIAVIVPAHDESAGMKANIAALRGILPDDAHLLVVADNCTDDTAALARMGGADVIERIDPERRGKGYALAFARDHLRGSPPDVAIVVDADCRTSAVAIASLADAAMSTGAPVQAAYLMTGRTDLGPKVQLSGFAFLVKNLLRQRGLARIGAPAVLTGSGMAFPWPIFATAPLATGDTVEDLSLGIALARIGCPPVFLAEALVQSDPSSVGGTLAQRQRWEHGFLATARSQALPLLRSGHAPMIWLGLHLIVPPLALLMIANVILFAMLALLVAAGGSVAPAGAQAVIIGLLTLLLAFAWLRHGRSQIRAAALLHIPVYILWKLPIYLAAVLRRERRWIRTSRD